MGRAARGIPKPWMRSEKTVWACFRTGVRFPSPPPRRRGRHIVRGDFFTRVTFHSFCRGSFSKSKPPCLASIWFCAQTRKLRCLWYCDVPRTSGFRGAGCCRIEQQCTADPVLNGVGWQWATVYLPNVNNSNSIKHIKTAENLLKSTAKSATIKTIFYTL